MADTNKCPDFLIQKDNFKCYVEATIVKSMTVEEEKINNTNGYSIQILGFDLNTSRTLSGKTVAREISRLLDIGIKEQLTKFDFLIKGKDYSIKLDAHYTGQSHDSYENRSNIAFYETSVRLGNIHYVFHKVLKEKAFCKL